MKPRRVLKALLPLLVTFSCNKAPDDPFCSYEPLPESAGVPAAQGAVQIVASTDEYFYVLDSTGTELAHNKLSRPLAFMPGSRTVKVNNTSATVQIAAGSPVELKTGAIVVHGATTEYYYVVNATGNELAHHKLE